MHCKMNRIFISDVNYLHPITFPTIILTVLGLLILFLFFGTLIYVLHILSFFFLVQQERQGLNTYI